MPVYFIIAGPLEMQICDVCQSWSTHLLFVRCGHASKTVG